MRIKRFCLTALFCATPLLALAAGSSADQLQSQINQLNQQINSVNSHQDGTPLLGSWMKMAPISLGALLSSGTPTNSELLLLDHRQSDTLSNQSLYLIGKYKPLLTWTNYKQTGFSDTTRTKILPDNVKLAVIGTLTNWATTNLYIQGDSGINQAYLLLGNLKKSPVYFLAGQKPVDFGDFSRQTIEVKPLTTTTFQSGNKLQAALGYTHDGLNLAATAFNGEQSATFTNSSSRIITPNNWQQVGNFAVQASYKLGDADKSAQVGAGYMNGSGFTSQTGNRNAVYDLNATLQYGALKVLAEYDKTTRGNGSALLFTNHRTATNDIVVAAQGDKIYAWNLAGQYSLPNLLPDPSLVSASVSSLVLGSGNDEGQYVLGYRVNLTNDWYVGAEYAYNTLKVNDTTYKGFQTSFVTQVVF